MGKTYQIDLECGPGTEITCTRPANLGTTVHTGLPSGSETAGGTPMDHLGVALGSCLLHFARNFLARRGEEAVMGMHLTCTVDERRCEIETLRADLELDLDLAAEEQQHLDRLLRQCPIHKALESARPVEVHITACHGLAGLA